MKDLQLIKSERFGEMEADIYSNGDDMFMTIGQLAACLGYADRSGVQKIVDRNDYLNAPEFSGWDNLSLPAGGTQRTRVFTEDGIYEVTMLSGQPKAKEFRTWIRGILKALRSGSVRLVSTTDPAKKALAEAKLNNSRARLAAEWRKIAGIVRVPEYQDLCASYAATALAGKEIIPLPSCTEHLYTATEIGAMLGGIDKAKIGHIANVNGLKAPEYGKPVWDKSPYSNKQVESFRYNDKALERFRDILGIPAG